MKEYNCYFSCFHFYTISISCKYLKLLPNKMLKEDVNACIQLQPRHRQAEKLLHYKIGQGILFRIH